MRRLLVFVALSACGGSPDAAPPAPKGPPPSAPVDLNTASADVLATLPGVTPKLVHEFEEYRPYVSIEQFRKELGKYVSQDQIAAWEPFVYVPIAVNGSDAATLQQLRGLDAAEAAQLIAGRPYADVAAFEAAAAGLVDAGALDTAKGWLRL